jgi:hypothetical protein
MTCRWVDGGGFTAGDVRVLRALAHYGAVRSELVEVEAVRAARAARAIELEAVRAVARPAAVRHDVRAGETS